MKIVTISDTHNKHNDIEMPEGDVLVVAGDFTGTGTYLQLERFIDWLDCQEYKHKIVVAGNHELGLERSFIDWDFRQNIAACDGAHYLKDEAVTIDGVKFYGAPWQPQFCDWAFNLPRGEALKQKWDLIPDDTDVLITHGPAHSILDTNEADDDPRKGFGCADLYDAVFRVKPKYHIFGHIHGGYGKTTIDGITFVNTAILDEGYQVANKPWVLEI